MGHRQSKIEHWGAVYGTLMTGERNYRWSADALEWKPCASMARSTTPVGPPAFALAREGGGVAPRQCRHLRRDKLPGRLSPGSSTGSAS